MSYILSFIIAFIYSHANILIIGDSQSGRWSLGGALENEFIEFGASVDRYSFPGWSNDRLWSFVQGLEESSEYGKFSDNSANYDIVFLIGGGNDIPHDMTDSVINMINYFSDDDTLVFYSILPPATEIANMDIARRSFRILEEVEDRRFWHSSGLYEQRMTYRESLRSMIYNLTDAYVVDIVQIVEDNGMRMPSFTDGIHIPYSFARRIAGCIIPFGNCE